MFSKENSRKLRQDFWISFGKSFPRKWILYNTKIKDLAFKFHFDTKLARVSIEIENNDLDKRREYFNKFVSLKGLLTAEISEVILEESFILDNGKEVSSVYIQLDDVSIHNKNTWQETMYFFKETMEKLESFWWEYEDFIKS